MSRVIRCPEWEDYIYIVGGVYHVMGRGLDHVLIRAGNQPLIDLLRNVLGGYASRYSLRHKRVGYKFQNRYRKFVHEAVNTKNDFMGGGLIRSCGGWGNLVKVILCNSL